MERNLGAEKLYRAYPYLRDAGDDILFEEKTDQICERLKDIMSKDEFKKY